MLATKQNQQFSTEHDKLLYKHYANRPWAALFRSQQEYRDHLEPMFRASEPLAIYDPIGEQVESLWRSGATDVKKIAENIGKSPAIVRRRIHERGLLTAPFRRGRPPKLKSTV